MKRVRTNFRYKPPIDQQIIDRQRYLEDEGEVPWRLGGGTHINSMLDTFNRGGQFPPVNNDYTFLQEKPVALYNAGGAIQQAARRLQKYPNGGTVGPDDPPPGFERRAGLLPGMDLTANIPYELDGKKGRLKTFDNSWAKHFNSGIGKPPVISAPETFNRSDYNNWKASYSEQGTQYPNQFMEGAPRYAEMRRSFKNPVIQSSSTGEVDFRNLPNSQHRGTWEGVFRNTAFFPDPEEIHSKLGMIPEVTPTLGKPNFPSLGTKTPVKPKAGKSIKYAQNDPFRHYPGNHRRHMGYFDQGGNIAVDYDRPSGVLGHARMGGKLKKYGLC